MRSLRPSVPFPPRLGFVAGLRPFLHMDLSARPQSGRAVSTPGLTGAPRSRLQRPCPWPEGRVTRASQGHARPRRGSPRLLSGSGVPGRPCGSHTEPAGPEPETLGPAPHAARHGGPATGRAGTWTLAEKSLLSHCTSSQLQIPQLPQPRERAERPGRASAPSRVGTIRSERPGRGLTPATPSSGCCQPPTASQTNPAR